MKSEQTTEKQLSDHRVLRPAFLEFFSLELFIKGLNQ